MCLTEDDDDCLCVTAKCTKAGCGYDALLTG